MPIKKIKLQSKLWRINGMTIFMDFKRPFVKRHSIFRPLYFILIFCFHAFHTYIPHMIFTLLHILPYIYFVYNYIF